MELSIYNIIKKPIISDKAYRLNKLLNQLVLEVHPKATKPLIKNAIEKLFNVKVKKLRTAIRKYRDTRALTRRFNAHPSIHKMKIVYVTLAEGYSLNLFEQMRSSVENAAKIKNEG